MARLPGHFRLYGLLLALLSDQRLVDVRDHTWKNRQREREALSTRNGLFIVKLKAFNLNISSPPPAIVALMSESNSSSPLMASCKWRGVIRFTLRSFDAFPANSRTCERQNLGFSKQQATEAARRGFKRRINCCCVSPSPRQSGIQV